MAQRLGTIVATRKLKRLDRRGSVLIRVGLPRRRRTGEWACPYQLTGLADERIRRVLGEDSIQALHLALEAIRMDLKPFEKQLTWTGAPGDLFLPEYVPYYYGTKFAEHLSTVIEEEMRQEGRRIQQRARRRGLKRKGTRGSRGAAA
jgi:hypothetical protein